MNRAGKEKKMSLAPTVTPPFHFVMNQVVPVTEAEYQ